MKLDSLGKIGPRRYYLGGALLVLVGLVIGLGLSAGMNFQPVSTAQKSLFAAISSSSPIPESPFVGVVEKALPAVVFIDVRKKLRAGDDSEDPQDELFRRFFDTPRHPQRVPTSGSGFIVDDQGHILTNNHVVQNAEDITVTLNDKRSFKAKVVGTDPASDVAVIKIEGQRLPVVPLGDSDRIRVGDWAIAIGNPLGQLKGSVTVGIVSAQGRSSLNIFGGTPEYQDFIQTDASINFGNSGGPLCNIRGEAIGINTAINPSGQGIGFAIPINLAKHVAEQLVAHGEVTRAWLGVTLGELTPEIAEGFGLDTNRGVVVASVVENQPAARAGLKRNDVIVEFDGQPVTDLQKFRLRVADTPVGKRVPIVVLREGKRMNFTVTLGDRTIAAGGRRDEQPVPERSEGLGGLSVRDLTPEEKAEARVANGVMVTDVEEGSAADDAGLQPNLVIEEVNARPASDAAAFTRLLKQAKTRGKPAVLLVHSGRNTQFVPLRLSE
ncbi:MAG TPA: Do family serine endopeptidase [Candidatus Eisenbacteria bacterium]|jgi:serine protease Do